MLTTFTSPATKFLQPWKTKLFAEQKYAHQRWIKIASFSTKRCQSLATWSILCDYKYPLLLFKQHNQLLRYMFCPNRNVFDTMLKFSCLAGLPSYLQRSCYIPKHLGKHSSKPTKLKMHYFYSFTLTRIESKASLYSMGCTACKQTY